MKVNLRPFAFIFPLLILSMLAASPACAAGVANMTGKNFFLHSRYVKNQFRAYNVGVNKSVKILTDKGALLPHGSMKSNSDGVIVEKTISVEPDGSAEMKVSQTGWKDASKRKAIAARIPPMILKVDKQGVITKSDALQTAPNVTEIMNAFMIYVPPGMALMPNTTVKVGDSWKVSIPNPYWQGKPIDVRSRLAGVERIRGNQALKVSEYYSIPIFHQFDKNGYSTEDVKQVVATVNGTVSVITVNYIQPSSMILVKRNENVTWKMRFTGLNAVAQSHITRKSVRVEASAALRSQLVKVENPKLRRVKR